MFTNKKQRYHGNELFWAESSMSLAGLVRLTYEPFLRASVWVQGAWTVYIRPAILISCVRRGWCGAVWSSLDSNWGSHLLPGKPWTRVQLVGSRKGRLPGPPTTEPGTEAPPALSSSGGLRVASVLSYSDSPSGHEDSQTATAARESRSRTRVWRDAHVSLASYARRVFYHIRIS